MRGHEVDDLGRDVLGRAHQVALVLAVLTVQDDDRLALAQVLDHFRDVVERSPVGL